MCGIVGYLSRSGRLVLGEAKLTAMRDTMVHRGPDGSGTKLLDSGRVGLAHRRLAIIDLSTAGREPMSFLDRYWLTFNGEIYNAAALRGELAKLGCRFRSSCDAEVLLAAYATWGRACVQRFVGMWAFAIWDESDKTLFCSRDRFGVKPLYYHDDGDLFVFASEIRAILASGSVPLQPNRESLVAYLQAGLVDGLESTFFHGIRRLQPGYCLLLSDRGDETWRYWSPDMASFSGEGPTPELIERVRYTFEEAVRSHLTSDAPIGVSLSGGLDSSSVFAVASRIGAAPLRTYTAYYDEPGPYDERRYSDLMTARYPVEAHQLRPERRGLLDMLPQIVWHLEEPPLAHGVYARWCIAAFARAHIKVLLTGQGGDELLAGYPAYLGGLIKDYWMQGRLFRACLELSWSWRRQGRQVPIKLFRSFLNRYFPGGFRKDNKQTSATVLGPLLKGVVPCIPAKERSTFGQSRLDNLLNYDIAHGSLPMLLKYEDKINMAFSIEGRVPFLDHRFAELCFSLGARAKIREGWSKVILREAMDGILPAEVQWRRGKTRFTVPYGAWIGVTLFKEAQTRIMDSAVCRDGYLDRAQIERLLRDHQKGRRHLPGTIWKWLCLCTWFDGNPRMSNPSYSAQPDCAG